MRCHGGGAGCAGGSPEEDPQAAKSHISYAGPYAYREGEVVHRVTVASCPNWVDGEQVRKVRLGGQRLELSVAGNLVQGQVVTARVQWRKAG